MRFYLSLYLLVAAVFLFTASGRLGLSDSVSMFNVSQSIVTDGTFSSEPCDPQFEGHLNHCVPGRRGRYYAGFGLLPSLLAAPLVVGGKLLSTVLHIHSPQVPRVLVSVFTALLAPLACVSLAMWMVILGYSRQTAMVGACILAFASPYWHFAVKGFYSEPYFTVFLVLAGCLLSLRKLAWATIIAGLSFGLACGSRVNGVILYPAFIAAIALQVREQGWNGREFLKRATAFSVPFGLCAMLIGWANYVRFGSPLKTGYHLAFPTAAALFSSPFPRGVAGLLFNGEVGLLIFAPWFVIALLCLPLFLRAHLPEGVLCATVFIFNFVFFAKYDSWHAGWVAGPRMLVPTLPFLIMALAPAIESRRTTSARSQTWKALSALTVACLIVAFLIQVLGMIYPEERYYTLAEYYQHRSEKPWWLGSIPLASIDFLNRMTTARAQAAPPAQPSDVDPLRVAHAEDQAYASVGSASNEEDFLAAFPNPENLTLPNLMFLKMKFLGLPSLMLYGYPLFACVLGGIGVAGLRRFAASAPA